MDPYLTLESVEPLIGQLNARIEELEREVADLRRHNEQLREAVQALMAPVDISRLSVGNLYNMDSS